MKGLLGRKLGMTQVFTTDGDLIPVTVVEVSPNVVLQKKTVETDGYEAIQLGYDDKREKLATKAEIGHAKKANSGPKRFVREIRGTEMMELEVGSAVDASVFQAGDMVDVTGISKGHGFSGSIKRHNHKLGPASHGSGHHRHRGSLATGGITSRKGKIDKGTPMAGQYGAVTTTNQNLEIIKSDNMNHYLLIKGNIPGPRRGLVVVKTTVKRIKQVPAVELVDYIGVSETVVDTEEEVLVAPEVLEEVAAEVVAEPVVEATEEAVETAEEVVEEATEAKEE